MGIIWGQPKKAGTGTGAGFFVAMPTEGRLKENLWNLWKSEKDRIKADGFGISQNRTSKQWEIKYWHNYQEGSRTKNEAGVEAWLVDFEQKVRKWQNIMEKRGETAAKTDDDAPATSRRPQQQSAKGKEHVSVDEEPEAPIAQPENDMDALAAAYNHLSLEL